MRGGNPANGSGNSFRVQGSHASASRASHPMQAQNSSLGGERKWFQMKPDHFGGNLLQNRRGIAAAVSAVVSRAAQPACVYLPAFITRDRARCETLKADCIEARYASPCRIFRQLLDWLGDRVEAHAATVETVREAPIVRLSATRWPRVTALCDLCQESASSARFPVETGSCGAWAVLPLGVGFQH